MPLGHRDWFCANRIIYVWRYHSCNPGVSLCHPYEKDPYLVTLKPERLGQQMRWLRKPGLSGASMRELPPHARRRACTGRWGIHMHQQNVPAGRLGRRGSAGPLPLAPSPRVPADRIPPTRRELEDISS